MQETKLQKPKDIFIGAIVYSQLPSHNTCLTHLGVTLIQADITQ